MHRRARTVGLAAATLGAAAILGACGGGEGADRSEPEPCRRIDGDAFTIVAENMAFVDRCLSVEPGVYEVTFDNSDDRTGHDLHIIGPGVDARTPLTVGPDRNSVEVDLSVPGRYRYICDPHPEMVGEMVVDEAAPAPSGSPSTTAVP